MTTLTAEALYLAHGRVRVVHEARLRVQPGEVSVLVGPNGSGKSTLLRSLARLHDPDSGAVRLDGADVRLLKRAAFAKRVTLLSQSRPVPNGLSVRDVVEFGRQPHRGRWRADDPEGPAAVDRALELTGTAELADRGVDRLSGGQLQRVWLASCLAQDTGVLLLDEPTNHLDLRFQVEVLDLVDDLARTHGVAVGMVLHDLDQAAAVADRIVVLAEGRVVADGTPEEALGAELLSRVYGITVAVDHDPLTGMLRTRAIGRHHARATASV